jgi:urease accessory protein UreE
MDRDGLTIIQHATGGDPRNAVPLRVDRWTLAKTRWRGAAADGREFGFDLTHPLKHGDVVADGYVIEQQPEDVLIVPLSDSVASASLAWNIGNIHQSLQVTATEIITADDSAVRNLFQQQSVKFACERRVFEPLRATHGHHHHHHD